VITNQAGTVDTMKTKFLKTGPFIVVLGLMTVGFVRPIVVNVEETPRAKKFLVQEAIEQKKILKTEKDPLARANLNEALQQWEPCVLEARKVSVKSPIRDWALLLELSCAIQGVDPDGKAKAGKNAGTLLSQTLRKVEGTPLRDSLAQEKIKPIARQGRLALCEYMQKHARWKELRFELQKAFTNENEYERNDRATLYELAGDLLVADRQTVDAFNQFQRARDLNPSDDSVESKLRSMAPMLPSNTRDQLESKLKAATPSASQVVIVPSTDEQEITSLAENYISHGDQVSGVEALAKLIHKFPGGLRSKWAQDKIYELLNNEIEKSKGPQGPTVAKKKILNMMEDFDSDRLYDWGKSLFDVQMYADAAPLLRKSAEQIAGSAKASHPLYLAGRAYQMSNDHNDAKEIYQKILKSYSASPEAVDAAIQWALVNINEDDGAEAIAHLEVARSHRMTNQQDLVSLFWLYQSYKTKNVQIRIDETGNDLIQRFGLTYYGIIAFQDLKKALPQFPKVRNNSAKVYFSQEETEALERAKLLLNSGMLNEASEELLIFSNRNLSKDEEAYLANFYAQAVKYQKVFSLLSSLFDLAPERKTDFFVKRLFPKEFWLLVTDDTLRADLDPYLLLSVMKQESAFDQNAVSRSGALGLMQMIPPTADDLKKELKYQGLMPQDLNDPAVNVRFCAYYLARLIKKYNGSIPLALAAYNAGPARINQFINARGGALRDTWVDELPWAETSFYVKSILKNYIMYRTLYGGLTQLPTPPWSTVAPASK
jgi:soluble lytic murein transglycosylase